MLTAIVRLSLRLRGIIIALACAFIGYGLYVLSQSKSDVFPEFAPPQVSIQTESPGFGPEQVELLVTQPIENAINGLDGIETLRSSSIQGLSLITVIFRPQSDIYRNRQLIAERLTSLVGKLPQGIVPAMTPLTSSTSSVFVVGLTSEKRSLMDLRTIADWTVKQRLLSLPGVAKVSVFGGDLRQIQIQVTPGQLARYNLSIEDVVTTAKLLTGIRGGGFVDTQNQRIILSTEGQSLNARELANKVFIHSVDTGIPLNLRLGDIAKVTEAPEPPVGAASIMGKPGVQLIVSSQYGANTLEVTRRIEQALKEIEPALAAQGVILHSDIFRPANFIETSIRNIKESLLLGAILVIIVLFLFLFNLRSSAISCLAIPLSLLAAVTILDRFGISLNTMTLGGLAIAIGAVVDDAIIDVENVLRRLKENRYLKNPLPVFQVVLDASIEVRSAIVYATFAIVLVFLPILTMSGIAGRLFGPLAVAYILAILASLLVALTVTPALCLVLLNKETVLERRSPFVEKIKEKYRALLLKVEEHPKAVIIIVSVFIVIGIAALPFFGGGFLPELKEGHFIIHMSMIPGTSIEESLRAGHEVGRELLKIPYVRTVAQRVGRAEKSDDVWGTHYSELDVDLKPLHGEEAEFAQSEIRKKLAGFPGANFAVKTFLTERVEEVLSGYTASVVLNLYGNDLDKLDEEAGVIAKLLREIRGATEVQIQSPPGTPQLTIQLRNKDLSHWGFDPLQVLDAIRVAYQGEVVGQIYDGNGVFDVSVILDSQKRKSIDDIGSLPLRSPVGTFVRLNQLADIHEVSGRYVVLHQGARRMQTITCNVTGRDINSFVTEAKNRIRSTIALPSGVYVEFSGAAEAQSRSKQDLIVYSLLAGLGIILFLSIVIGNIRNLILVLFNLPFALVGGVLSVFLSGGWLSIGSLVGFVTLFGITLRNSIMMISHYEHLVTYEGMTWGKEAAIRGALERLTPILMTALVTALGLLPLALGSQAPGREIEGPMAIVILGGLITSTALNLLVLPTLALRYGLFQEKKEANDDSR